MDWQTKRHTRRERRRYRRRPNVKVAQEKKTRRLCILAFMSVESKMLWYLSHIVSL